MNRIIIDIQMLKSLLAGLRKKSETVLEIEGNGILVI
jgi:hypothetical protein